MKIDRTREDLQSELKIQQGHLFKSCFEFDKGDITEAKRISTILRTLLKDGKNSQSLLGLLSLKKNFVSYGLKADPSINRNFLVLTSSGNKNHQYFPNFVSNAIPKRILPFSEWWDEIVIIDFDMNKFSRKDIILSLAEMDGGAHVDPQLEQNYHKLTKENSQQVFVEKVDYSKEWPEKLHLDQSKPIFPPVWHTIRQIAHELIESLALKYPYDQKEFYEGSGITGIEFVFKK